MPFPTIGQFGISEVQKYKDFKQLTLLLLSACTSNTLQNVLKTITFWQNENSNEQIFKEK